MSTPNTIQRLIQRLTASRAGSAVLPRTLNRLDRGVAGLTGGRYTATAVLAGVPVLTVETIGARTGRRHCVTLLAISRGENLILIATAFGSRKHPAWYHNLKAHPVVDVRLGRVQRPYRAREVSGEEREACWAQATAVYPGYSNYVERAGRTIPVLLLIPETRTYPLPGATDGCTGMRLRSEGQDDGGLK